MRIQINVPQHYDVVIMLDCKELRLNKKNKKISRTLSAGMHQLQVRQINMLDTSVWVLNILEIILDLFGSMSESGESRKLEQAACSICLKEQESISFVVHYGNHQKIEMVSDDLACVKQNIPSKVKTTQIERRWIVTNIIAIILLFSVAIVPCILISIDSFRSDSEALPAAKVFFPCLAACFTAMAFHLIYRRIKYKM